MRIVGAVFLVLGLLFSLSIIGAFIGVPMMLIGLVMLIAGGRRKTVITNVVQVSNTVPGHRDDSYPAVAAVPANRAAIGRQPEPRTIAPPSYLPAARASAESVADRFERAPSQPSVFNDIENEIAEECVEILRHAKADGYDVFYLRHENRVIVRWRDEPEKLLFSNRDIRNFGRAHGYP